MRKNVNSVNLQGRVYEFSKLALKTVKNEKSENFGQEFIGGEISIAVDEEGLNIVPISFRYVPPVWKSKEPNQTFKALKQIITSGKSWVENGKDEATKVSISTSIGINDFYTEDGQLIESFRCEGGFVSIINSLSTDEKKRNHYEADMLINKLNEVEADEEKGVEDHLEIKGAVFNFRNELIPVAFSISNPKGAEYFLSLEPSNANPVYLKLWGKLDFRNIQQTSVVESEWGEDNVVTREKKVKNWIVTGNQKPYDFGDEKIMTADELKEAIQNREVHLAEVKKNTEEWRAQKASQPAADTNDFSAAAKTVATGNFNF